MPPARMAPSPFRNYSSLARQGIPAQPSTDAMAWWSARATHGPIAGGRGAERRAHNLAVYGRERPAETLVRTAVSARFMVGMGPPVRFRRESTSKGCCPFAAHGSIRAADAGADSCKRPGDGSRDPQRSRVRALPSPVCTRRAGRQSRWQEIMAECGKPPAQELDARRFVPTILKRSSVALPTLTTRQCCPAAARGQRAPWPHGTGRPDQLAALRRLRAAFGFVEVLRLFAALVAVPVADTGHRWRWSLWRRRHQARPRLPLPATSRPATMNTTIHGWSS
jgi:hypothetical protein